MANHVTASQSSDDDAEGSSDRSEGHEAYSDGSSDRYDGSVEHSDGSSEDSERRFSTIVAPGESLCNVCQNVFERINYPPFLSAEACHHKSIDSCWRAAAEGCAICYILWDKIMKMVVKSKLERWGHIPDLNFSVYGVSNSERVAPVAVGIIKYRDEISGEMSEWKPGDGLLPLQYAPDPSGRWLLTFGIYNFGMANDLTQLQIEADCFVTFVIEPSDSQPPIEPDLEDNFATNTGNDAVLDLSLKWTNHCLQTHPDCNTFNARSPETYPTRLLEIDPTDTTKIKLIETAHSNLNGPYIALSYCWGTSHMTYLTTKTDETTEEKSTISLETAKHGLDVSSLPLTFQESIIVCSKFGISHLWIDALCIVQDSEEDWRIEATRMQLVYSHAFLTIAADASADSAGGLFRERHSSLVRPVVVKPIWEGCEPKTYKIYHKQLWKHNIADSPLNSRAWVLQERYLSPRVLHFGDTQILWECRMHDCCETFSEGLPNSLKDSYTNFKGSDFELHGGALRGARPKGLTQADSLEELSPTMNSDNESSRQASDDAGTRQPLRQEDRITTSEPEFDGSYVDRSDSDSTTASSSENEQSEGVDLPSDQTALLDTDSSLKSDLQEMDRREPDLEVTTAVGEERPRRANSREGPRSKRRNTKRGRQQSMNGYYIWCRLLETYTQSRLTKQTDRLVAIHGLAEIMQARLGDVYHFGLWHNIFPSQLLWRIEHSTSLDIWNADHLEPVQPGSPPPTRQAQPIHLGDRPGYFRSPSWSWASLENPIETSRPSRTGNLIKVLGIPYWGQGEDISKDRRLIITGDIHIARLFFNSRHSHWMLSIDRRGMRVRPNGRRCIGATTDPKFVPIKEGESVEWPQDRMAYALAYPDVKPPHDQTMVFCLLVQRRQRTKALGQEGLYDRSGTISGLFLLKYEADGFPGGAYQRLGTFDTLETSGFMEEYCYAEGAKSLFIPSPYGWSEMIALY